MPQPIRKPCEVALTGISTLPEHAAALGSIVALSGYLEALLGHLLAYLTGASASVAMAMFHSVTSTDAQRAMLMAAAEQILAGAELDEFRDLMTDFRTRYGERSRLVHNVWGTSPDHPDKAVWCGAKDATNLSTQLASVREQIELELYMADPQKAVWRCCSLYTVKDLHSVHERLAQYAERVRLMAVKLQLQHPVIAARLAAEQPTSEPTIEPPRETLPDRSPG